MHIRTNEPVESFILDEGINEYGIHTQVSFEGDRVIKKQSYDASAMLEACKAERIATDGQRWGEMRKVGTIPMAEYAKFLAIKDNQERKKMIQRFLQQNPHFCTFDKYLK
jgi:hypothetical protein